MRDFLRFVGMGSIFATVEEFLSVLVLRGDVGAYVFTLVFLFPAFLTIVWLTGQRLRRLVASRFAYELIHFFFYGLIGLLIEWFAIGLLPWSDPEANPLLMLVFQLGMFSFWATVAFAPPLFVNPDERSRNTRRELLKFYIPYFVVACTLALLAPAPVKFALIIGSIIFGYLFLNVFYARYFVRSARECRAPA